MIAHRTEEELCLAFPNFCVFPAACSQSLRGAKRLLEEVGGVSRRVKKSVGGGVEVSRVVGSTN